MIPDKHEPAVPIQKWIEQAVTRWRANDPGSTGQGEFEVSRSGYAGDPLLDNSLAQESIFIQEGDSDADRPESQTVRRIGYDSRMR